MGHSTADHGEKSPEEELQEEVKSLKQENSRLKVQVKQLKEKVRMLSGTAVGESGSSNESLHPVSRGGGGVG